WRRHVREIDMWPTSKCDAPMCHGAGRISVRRSLERSNCCAVVKPKEEVEALVEIFLRFGRVRRDLSGVRPQAFEEGSFPFSAPALAMTSAKTKLLIKPVVCMTRK